jgi:hypothetical protein
VSERVAEILDRYENARRILGAIEDELLKRLADEEARERMPTGNLLRAMVELQRVLLAAERPIGELTAPRVTNVLQIIQNANLPEGQAAELLASHIRDVGVALAEENGLLAALYQVVGPARAKQMLAIEGEST